MEICDLSLTSCHQAEDSDFVNDMKGVPWDTNTTGIRFSDGMTELDQCEEAQMGVETEKRGLVVEERLEVKDV